MGLLAKVERRASIENPSTSLANPSAWLVEALGGGMTPSGVQVNQKTALKLSAVWACVNLLSQDVAKLPLITYERLERGKRRAREHAVFSLLHSEANPQMSAFNLRRTLQAHVVTWGKAFAEIERNGAGEPIGLWPLLPDRTEAHRVDGRKVIITRVGNEDIPLDPANVLHIPGLGFDGLRGYSVIGFAKQAIGGGMAAEQYGAAFFGNNARPDVVITRPDSLTEEAQQRIRNSWNKVHQGLSNAQRVGILDEGMDIKELGIPPEHAQFIASRQHSVEDVVRFFRVPPHKVQHLLHAGVRANVESENISYVTDTLQPWLVSWEQEINRTLFAERERETFFAEHRVEGLLRGDSAGRSQFYQSGINNGWLSPNDVRELENLNPVDGGDEYFIPVNLMPLSGAADFMDLDFSGGDEDEDEPEQDSLRRQMVERRAEASVQARHRIQQAHLRAFARTAGRVIAKEVRAVRRIKDKHLESRTRDEFIGELREFYDRFESVIRDDFAGLLTSYAELVRGIVAGEMGLGMHPDPQYDRFTQDFMEGLARRHATKSRRQLEAVVRDNPPETQAAAIEERLTEWEERRPEKVASSETVRAMGALSKAAYIGAGIMSLVWRAVGKSCPYCDKLNGTIVGVRDNFVRKTEFVDPADGEHEPMQVRANVGHPPLHSKCDCLVAPAFTVGREKDEPAETRAGNGTTPQPITLNLSLPTGKKRIRLLRDEDGVVEAAEVEE